MPLEPTVGVVVLLLPLPFVPEPKLDEPLLDGLEVFDEFFDELLLLPELVLLDVELPEVELDPLDEFDDPPVEELLVVS